VGSCRSCRPSFMQNQIQFTTLLRADLRVECAALAVLASTKIHHITYKMAKRDSDFILFSHIWQEGTRGELSELQTKLHASVREAEEHQVERLDY